MDYIDFSLDGVTSQELGVMRTSEGSGFETTLLPEFSNNIITIPSGSNLVLNKKMEQTTRGISFVSGDKGLTEKQLRTLKRLLNKNSLVLIFDEMPMIKYNVVLASPPTFNFNVFNENGNRVYRGTGRIEVILKDNCGYIRNIDSPFISETTKLYSNYLKWYEAIGKWGSTGAALKYNDGSKQVDFDSLLPLTSPQKGGKIYLRNYGDLDTPLNIIIRSLWTSYTVELFRTGQSLVKKTLSNLTVFATDTITINSSNLLIDVSGKVVDSLLEPFIIKPQINTESYYLEVSIPANTATPSDETLTVEVSYNYPFI